MQMIISQPYREIIFIKNSQYCTSYKKNIEELQYRTKIVKNQSMNWQ